ncbi:hypothetical protein NWO25_18690 [Enterococcus lactis]|nr:hypothetical protein [Enterococcus lactis]
MASIKQQPNGKWRYRVRYKENGKFREVSKSGFRTKRMHSQQQTRLNRKFQTD